MLENTQYLHSLQVSLTVSAALQDISVQMTQQTHLQSLKAVLLASIVREELQQAQGLPLAAQVTIALSDLQL